MNKAKNGLSIHQEIVITKYTEIEYNDRSKTESKQINKKHLEQAKQPVIYLQKSRIKYILFSVHCDD